MRDSGSSVDWSPIDSPVGFLILGAVLFAGCAVGGPQVGPQTASGYHTSEQFHFVTGNAQIGGTGYNEIHEVHTGFGMLFGAKAGVAFANVGGQHAPAKQTAEAHFDVMYSINRFGFGLSSSYGYELASVNQQDYNLAGLGLAAFGQFGITSSLFVNAGIGRLFLARVSRAQQPGDSLSSAFNDDADVTPYRAFGRLTWIFSDSVDTQWGSAVELRLTRTGAAVIQTVDVQWASTSVVAQILYIKF